MGVKLGSLYLSTSVNFGDCALEKASSGSIKGQISFQVAVKVKWQLFALEHLALVRRLANIVLQYLSNGSLMLHIAVKTVYGHILP